jgi:hypothetical protein
MKANMPNIVIVMIIYPTLTKPKKSGVWAFCGVALPYGGCYGEFGKLLVRVCGGWVGVCVFSKRNPLILHKPCGELLRKNSTMRVITS